MTLLFRQSIILNLLCAIAAGPTAACAQDAVEDSTAAQIALDVPENAGNASDAIEIAEPDESQIDWSALDIRDPDSEDFRRPRPEHLKTPQRAHGSSSWSRDDRTNGSSGVSVRRALFPAWDANAGVDMDVARLASPITSPATVPDRLVSDRQLVNSSAAAWLTAKVAGVPYLWDQTLLEARSNPVHETRFGTSMSKSLPLWGDQFRLTLQQSYFITQHGQLTGLGNAADYGVERDRSARLQLFDTGMTLLAGQSRSDADGRWISRIGAEQELFGGISVTGSISQMPDGGSARSISAGFRHRW